MIEQPAQPLDLQLPDIRTFEPDGVNYHYGAVSLFASHCGIRGSVPPPRGCWGHAWIPLHVSQDPVLVEQYLTRHEQIRGKEPMWVPEEVNAKIARGLGWESEAIGLPMTYLPEVKRDRIPGSLLVMPVHSDVGETFDWDGRDYASYIKDVRKHFSRVVVCIYGACMDNGYWVNEFREVDCEIVRGSHWKDANGLKRVQALLSSFEYVTTNGFGSHIAYAAYFGAKMSIYGTFININLESVKHHPLYTPENRFMEMWLEGQSQERLWKEYPFLFCHPAEAQLNVDWGRAQLGHHCKKSGPELRELFAWDDAALRRWRTLGEPKAVLSKKIRRAVPEWAKARYRQVRHSRGSA